MNLKNSDFKDYPIHFKEDFSKIKLGEVTLNFYTTWGVFSPKGIDKGTLLLLSYLDCEEKMRVLDLGCGYGPIGLFVAKKFKSAEVEMIDKDFVAVDCANFNIKQNELKNAKSYLSNGLSNVEGQFDRIYCNLPAKVGNRLTCIFLNQCKQSLKKEGLMQWVCINSLRIFMKRISLEIFGNYKKIKQGSQYTVFQTQQSG